MLQPLDSQLSFLRGHEAGIVRAADLIICVAGVGVRLVKQDLQEIGVCIDVDTFELAGLKAAPLVIVKSHTAKSPPSKQSAFYATRVDEKLQVACYL